MGRRRKTKALKVQKFKQPKLDTEFKCPFCEHGKSVSCQKDHKLNVWVLSCRVCGQVYTTPIADLVEPIDVYSEWIDKCERINKPPMKKKAKIDNSKEVITNEASSSLTLKI